MCFRKTRESEGAGGLIMRGRNNSWGIPFMSFSKAFGLRNLLRDVKGWRIWKPRFIWKIPLSELITQEEG